MTPVYNLVQCNINFTPGSITVGSNTRRMVAEGKNVKADSEGIPTGFGNFCLVGVKS